MEAAVQRLWGGGGGGLGVRAWMTLGKLFVLLGPQRIIEHRSTPGWSGGNKHPLSAH